MRSWIVALLLVTARAEASKPVAVMMGFSNDDTALATVFARRKAKLEACGYEVRSIEPTSTEDLRTKLAAQKLPSGTVFLADGHGGMFNRAGRRLHGDNEGDISPSHRFRFTDEEGRPRSSRHEVIQIVKDASTAPQMWVDACYSGGCRYCRSEGVGLGMVCTERQQSFNDASNTDHLIDLMCSGIGDCVLFREADQDGNGIISANELEVFIDDKLRQNRKSAPIQRKETGLFCQNDPAAIRQFKENCAQDGGAATESNMGFRYLVKCKLKNLTTGREVESEDTVESFLVRFNLGPDEPSELFADAKDAVALLKSKLPKWPREGGIETRTSGNREFRFSYTDCSLEKKPPEAWSFLTCAHSFTTTTTDKKHPSRPTKMAPVSLAHTFTLRANRCARPKQPRGVPGLKIREGEHGFEVK